ncbi:MAG: hypothetical protein P8L22_08725 [Acidimicrobiales bacterium]|nr:hypothetical protein [Acidimicrobiales bacterium]
MRQMVKVDLDGSPQQIFGVLKDLEAYENWLGFVDSIETLEAEGDLPCWQVTLRAQIGPFARLKQLRMVLIEDEAPRIIRFVRRETDGKEHSDWELSVLIDGRAGSSSSVSMELSYSGKFWSLPLQSVFNSHVDAAKSLLQQTFAGDEDS